MFRTTYKSLSSRGKFKKTQIFNNFEQSSIFKRRRTTPRQLPHPKNNFPVQKIINLSSNQNCPSPQSIIHPPNKIYRSWYVLSRDRTRDNTGALFPFRVARGSPCTLRMTLQRGINRPIVCPSSHSTNIPRTTGLFASKP